MKMNNYNQNNSNYNSSVNDFYSFPNNGSYEEAYACYIYSLEYEKHISVIQEITYIESKISGSIKDINIENTLKNNNIPLLTSDGCCETNSEESESALNENEVKTYKNNFCRICGAKLQEGSRFCHKCGTEVL